MISTQSKSGVPVIILPTDRKMTKVAIFINTGSALETDTRGLAHFFEHLMFKGTPTRTPLEVIQQVEIMGADSNAYTSKVMTCYYMIGLNEHLERCMEILGDMTQNALFREEDVETEKSIVIQEIHQYDDEIDSVCWDLFDELTYGDTPVGSPILGTEESVRKLTRDDCLNFRSKHYVKGNVCVAVSSGLKKKKILDLVEKNFGSMPSGPRATFPKVQRLPGSTKVLKTPKFTQSCVHLGWQVNDHGNDLFFDYQAILANWLGGGMSSPLFQTVREKLGLAYQVGSHLHYSRDMGELLFYSKCEGGKHDVVINAMIDVLNDVRKNPNPLDFERAKNHQLVRLSRLIDNPTGQMESHVSRFFMEKPQLDFEKIREDILKIEQNQVLEHLETIVNTYPTVAVVAPE
jgi:predicted Zn-dependent peptidase